MKAAVAKTMDGHSLNDDPAPGWYRELVARRSGDKVDAYYYPPDGTQLRSRPDVRRYFEAHPDEAKVGDRRSRRPAAPSRRRRELVGGLWSKFGPIRTESRDRDAHAVVPHRSRLEDAR